MTPWWQRPTADTKKADREPDEQEQEQETEPRDQPAEERSEDEPAARRESRSRRTGSSRARTRARTSRPRKDAGGKESTVVETAPVDGAGEASVSLATLKDLTQEIMMALPERAQAVAAERKIALFCDLENIALGVRDSGTKFDVGKVLERLREKGKIIVKKAYADWHRYNEYKRAFHEAGIEMIDIPQKRYSGKNSADIKMVVDAMDLCYSKEHLDTYAVLSGDSDFSPLVSKLKENNKYVIGVGVKDSTSALLIDHCDEFIYYEDIWRDTHKAPHLESLSDKEREVFELLTDSIRALIRDNKDVLWGSMIKQTMQRKRPSFNEGYYGFSSFSELLEEAQKKKIVQLKKDRRSGSYIVTGFAKSA